MSKKGRDASRRVKEMQAAQRRAEQRRRNLVVGGVAAAVIAVVVGIGVAVQSNRDTTGANVVVPAGAVDTYGIARGDANAPVTMDLYEDFQCPICKAYEGILGDTITKNVDAGTLRVVYHPMAFLDSQSTTKYSSRALETAACVLNQDGPEAYITLHGLLFQRQPAEGSAGLTDEQLASLAEQAGASKANVERCQSNDTFTGWAKAATDAASKAHVTGTPTMFIDGHNVPITSQGTPQGAIDLVQQTIDAAAAGAGGGTSAPSSGGSSSGG
jgi:protein-disulfide isomerase